MLAVENPLLRGPIKSTDSFTMRQKSSACLELDNVKEKVEQYKAKAGKSWRILTEPVIPNSKREVCSKAYYKLEEIIQSCVLSPPKSSLHICEAPGGFVQCTCDEFKDDLEQWFAASLKDGIQFKKELLEMSKGSIANQGNILEEQVREEFTMKVDLVTGDGSFLEEDHNSLETVNFPLFVAQADIALRCLNKGGTFVCKFFEGMEPNTQMLLCALTNCFERVSIIKPISSKQTNSERYVVCRGFEKSVDIVNTVWETTESWIEELEEIMNEYCNDQKKSLLKVFKTIDSK